MSGVFDNINNEKINIRVGNRTHENCLFKFFLHGGKTMVFYSTTSKVQVSLPTKDFIEQKEAVAAIEK